MGKHGNKENGKQEKPEDGYQPRHSGGQDGFDWAKQEQAKEQEKKEEKK